MAARTPRRSFATPFVVTLAAAPACYVQPGPQQPVTTSSGSTDPQTKPATQPTPTPDSPPPVIVNPPRPAPAPVATTPNTRWRIYKDGASCLSSFVVSCPPKTACNPPPPKPYACPTNVDLATMGPVNILSSADGMTCNVEWGPMKCPAGAMCNPPPPTSVECPKP